MHGNRREVVCGGFELPAIPHNFRGRASDAARAVSPGSGSCSAPKTARSSPAWSIGDPARAFGASVSDPRRAHGLRPFLVLADEPAQWPPATGEKMISALRTGLGKVPRLAADCPGDAPGKLRSLVRARHSGRAAKGIRRLTRRVPTIPRSAWRRSAGLIRPGLTCRACAPGCCGSAMRRGGTWLASSPGGRSG